MFSHVVDGKVLDVHCKKVKSNKGHYIVYLGDIYLGQVFKLRFGWSVVTAQVHPFMGLSGFISKWKAYEVLLKAFDDSRKVKE